MQIADVWRPDDALLEARHDTGIGVLARVDMRSRAGRTRARTTADRLKPLRMERGVRARVVIGLSSVALVGQWRARRHGIAVIDGNRGIVESVTYRI